MVATETETTADVIGMTEDGEMSVTADATLQIQEVLRTATTVTIARMTNAVLITEVLKNAKDHDLE